MTSVGRLHSDLMLAAGFEAEPKFGNELFAVGEGVLGNNFVMGNGLASFSAGGLGCG